MKLENEKIIKQFLFGELSEENRFDFEERFITDASLFDEIKVVEDELIEKYVRGWMSVAEGSKFEKHFLTTNKRRERVEFSRQFITKIEEQKDAVAIPVKKNEDVTVEEDSIWDKFFGLLLTPKIAMAGALTLIIAVMGTWVLYQNSGVGKQDVVKNDNSETIETPIKQTPAKQLDLPNNNQNDSENNNQEIPVNSENNSPKQANDSNENINITPIKTPTPKKPVEDIKKTPTPTKTPPIRKTAPNPILALFAGTVRSGGKNNVLKLPKEAKSATLQLNLEGEDYKIFQAQLTDADGNVAFQRSNLKARNLKINFNIPAKNLKRGDYIIKLNGKNDSGENESVADFQFRVEQ